MFCFLKGSHSSTMPGTSAIKVVCVCGLTKPWTQWLLRLTCFRPLLLPHRELPVNFFRLRVRPKLNQIPGKPYETGEDEGGKNEFSHNLFREGELPLGKVQINAVMNALFTNQVDLTSGIKGSPLVFKGIKNCFYATLISFPAQLRSIFSRFSSEFHQILLLGETDFRTQYIFHLHKSIEGM